MLKQLATFFFGVAFFSVTGGAQPWAGVISPSRAIDWRYAGAPGGIPSRSTVCATLNPGASATQINAAIAACPSGQVVYLNTGTYNLSSGIVFNNKRGVTLRGAGADSTKLVFTGNASCGGVGGNICFQNGDLNWRGGPGNTASWTSGYSKGSTQITLSQTANLRVGTLLNLDQMQDSSDDGSVFQANNPSSKNCLNCNNASRSGRGQTQIVTVTAISGNTVTISPGLYMPNWRADRSPGAWWSGDSAISGSGVEDLSLDSRSVSSGGGIVTFYNASGCWMKGIRSLFARDSHVKFWQSARNTVKDSYFYGNQVSQSQSYGTDTYLASDNLVENNIFEHITVPNMNETSMGDVYAYNFSIDNFYNNGSNKDNGISLHSAYTHAGGNAFFLWEGNAYDGLNLENFHGPAHFVTAYRNWFVGRQAGKTSRTAPIINQSFQRYTNVVGNVLGDSTYHVAYTSKAGDSSTAQCDRSIYTLGWGGNCGNWTTQDCSGYVGCPQPDLKVETSLLRWGNYDTVSNANRFVAGEVPTGAAKYPNTVPSSQTLPPSLYLPGRPGWWTAGAAWPPHGPDVTGGDISNVAGHANKIPSHLCFEGLSNDGSNAFKSFRASSCYASGGGGGSGTPPPAPPAAPTKLQTSVQ